MGIYGVFIPLDGGLCVLQPLILGSMGPLAILGLFGSLPHIESMLVPPPHPNHSGVTEPPPQLAFFVS